MFIKVFEGTTPLEVESQVNEYLNSSEIEEYDLHSLTQSESMIVVEGKLERRITLTCIFIERLYTGVEEV